MGKGKAAGDVDSPLPCFDVLAALAAELLDVLEVELLDLEEELEADLSRGVLEEELEAGPRRGAVVSTAVASLVMGSWMAVVAVASMGSWTAVMGSWTAVVSRALACLTAWLRRCMCVSVDDDDRGRLFRLRLATGT